MTAIPIARAMIVTVTAASATRRLVSRGERLVTGDCIGLIISLDDDAERGEVTSPLTGHGMSGH